MGKMVYLMLSVITIQVGLYLVFDIGIPTSSLWDVFRDPQNWDSLSLTTLIADSVTAIGLAAIVIGTFFYKSDFVVFAGLTTVLLTFGKQLINLWQNIASQPNFGDAGSASLAASVIVGPIIFLYIMTVLEFWRGRD